MLLGVWYSTSKHFLCDKGWLIMINFAIQLRFGKHVLENQIGKHEIILIECYIVQQDLKRRIVGWL